MIDFVPAPATLPPGQRVYAIGDVHGCLDRLAAVHEQIAEDLATRPVETAVLVHLGDYVDRGLDSAQVVDWLIGGAPVPVERIVNLMGNHEDMMLQALPGTTRRRTAHGWRMAAPTHCSVGTFHARCRPPNGQH